MSARPDSPATLTAVLGPTNTGKTFLAVERMLGHASGMIGLPLRLLAREIYDKAVQRMGAARVALITGEEKILPARPSWFVCTVEAMPLTRPVEFVAVDEIQLAADSERGHVFTHRLLCARGTAETVFMGAATMAPLLRRLVPDARLSFRERYSELSWSGPRKVSRLPRRSAVVAFSAGEVYAIAELIRRQRGGAAVVMGGLSPRTRNAQVALFQSGEVDFLVATDAIGMGLNMDLDHVALASLVKFDGARTRPLHPHEIGQIAGRAGRFRRNGTFGTTAGCEAPEADTIAAVEAHRFEPVAAALWRNAALDFASLDALLRSLSAPARRPGLKASDDALDERVLRAIAAAGGARGVGLARLWEACQTPDFRKTEFDDHVRLVGDLDRWLAAGTVPEDWMAEGLARAARAEGEIEALQARLAQVRTLAYIAHRPDWLTDPTHWREASRAVEDRLSDTLHEKLMARFVDRRTSVLLRGLGERGELLAGVGADGEVTVEGFAVGRLRGLAFDPVKGAGTLERKALRRAAERVIGPEIDRRLGALAAAGDDAFAVSPDGLVLWRGEAAGALAGDNPFNPLVRLLTEEGGAPARGRAARRLEAFVAAEAGRRLGPLKRLADAVSGGALRGLARGLAWRLSEAGGVLDRREVEADLAAMSQAERRALRALGVRIGAFCLYLPGQINTGAAGFARAFAPANPARAAALRGELALGAVSAPANDLERLGEALRRAPRRDGGAVLDDSGLLALGLTPEKLGPVLRALGFVTVGKRGADQAWRRPWRARPAPAAPSPFAALASLEVAPPRRRRKRRRV